MTHESGRAGSARRVFFALWPSNACGAELERLAQGLLPVCGGRAMRRDRLHMTLVFVGAVAGSLVEDLLVLASGIGGRGFDLEFDSIAWQRRQRIVWAQCSSMPEALTRLAADLAQALRDAGFALDDRPFKAHVTLVRDGRCKVDLPAIRPVGWRVGEFMLLESHLERHGSTYSVIGRWPLG